MTTLDRHAALGPIAWTEGGMRATTRDGFAVEIERSDASEDWLVYVGDPPDSRGTRWCGVAKANDLREARVLFAEYVRDERAREARRLETVRVMAWMFDAVIARAARPSPEGRTEDA